MKKIIKVLLPLIINVVLGSLCVYFGKISYDNIINPKFAPKSFVFPIVWSILYLIIFFTAYKCAEDKKVYWIYVILMSMHTVWNFCFFVLGAFLLSLIVLVVLYFTSWIFVYYLSQNKKAYFYYNLPYLLWLMVALYLNVGVYLLN